MRKMHRAVAALIPALLLTSGWMTAEAADATAAAAERPNVVLIMTDNHGAWTLGCYGNPDVRTPHIDRLAKEGTLFTRAFSSNPVCSPTRATYLTGLVPSQHGVHSYLTAGGLQVGPEARSTLAELTSLPEVVSEAGYSCGLVGKWHLGDNLHRQEGFDDYWITTPHGHTTTFYGAQVIEDGRVREEPEYLTDFWTRHAVRFIEQRAQDEDEQPFFLFLAYNGPYALGRLLLNEGRNRHAAYYADKPLPSFPREPTHPWQHANRDFINNPVSIRRVATEISGVDDGVGTVLQALKEHGLEKNTVVVFVADQGWVGGQGGFFGMGDHTRPVTARDGMLRIPMIWRHPGRIAADRKSDRLVTNYDFLPTLLSHLGLGDRMPKQPKSPGQDFSEEFTKDSEASGDAVFFEFEELRGVRTERWKYVHRHPNGPHELYDLQADPDEFNNLVRDPAHAETRRGLKRRLDAFFAEYAEPKYDLWHGGRSQARVFAAVDEEIRQADPVEPPPLADGFQPAEISVPEGFTVELAAGPPLVTHPTMACFDDRGRLFVCNNAGVNMSAEELERELPNSIRLLEDRDGDGRFDRSTVFADRMTYPMGAAWHEGALYVASPPNIWRLEDTDDDGVADRRDVLVSKFGYTGNAADIHGCFLGPDGRLWWCDGFHGHEFRDEDGKVTSKRAGSYIFSCRPDGSDVRLHCGGGMDNPVEVDFTDTGDVIGSVNILYSRPRVDALVHWLHGGAYPHREKILEEIQITGDLLGPMHEFGHVAVSGVRRYRSGVMDHRWRDNFFAAHFNAGKVVRLEIEKDGSTYRATQREFLTGTSRDFHPTDIVEDADGSLLVIDTGGWFYRGCPTSQLAKPDVLGAIYRVRRAGMTTLPDPRGRRIDWKQLTDAQLVALLNDTRFAVRERAIAACARRGATIVPRLAQTVQRADGRVRQNALWALTRLVAQLDTEVAPAVAKAARAAIRSALSDRAAGIRQIACRSIATYPDPAALERLMKIVQADEPPVRREAAHALGVIGEARAVPALLEALARPDGIDRSEEHAIIYALIEINDAAATAQGLAARRAGVQRGALIALDQMDAGELAASDVVPLLDADDADLRQTALDVFGRRIKSATGPERATWITAASATLGRWLHGDGATLAGRAPIIAGLVGTLAAEDAVATLVGETLTDPKASAETRRLLLDAIAAGNKLPLHAGWVGPLERELGSDDPQVVERALAAVSAIASDRFAEPLRQLAADDKRPTPIRLAALQALARRGTRLSNEGFGFLTGLVERGGPEESARAAQMLGASSLTPAQLRRLAPLLEAAGPLVLRDLIRPFQRSGDAAARVAFLDGIEKARSLLSLPTNEVSDIVKSYPAELRPRANALLDRMRQHDEDQLARLDALLPLLERGDPARGREAFYSEKSKCATCHRVGQEGGKVGPDLSTIGANRSARDLIESVVFPSSSIVRQYEPYNVLTDSGRTYDGLIVRETADTLYIQQQTGDPVALPRAEITVLQPSAVSIMPKGLEQTLTEQQLADIVAWLLSLK